MGAVATSCGVGGLDCTVDRIASTMIMNFMGKGGAPAVYLTTAATEFVGGALLASTVIHINFWPTLPFLDRNFFRAYS